MTAAAFDHIVLISLDTLRADAIAVAPTKLWQGKHGLDRELRTSLLDELAAKGAFFSNCITAAPYTTASHASIFTGRWPLRHGVFEYFNRKLKSTTLFERARALGYRTVFSVDFPIMLGPWLGFDRGVDEYLVEDEMGALDRIESATRPTFSFVHFGALHIPYGFHKLRFAPDAYPEKIEALEARLPDLGVVPEDRLGETYRGEEDVQLLLRYKRIVEFLYANRAYSELLDLYLDGVEFFLRSRFAPFVERLSAVLGGTRHLLVLFGDHGEEYDPQSYGHFNSVAEGVLRVPVIFLGSGVRPGLFRDRIRTIDIAPTILDLLEDRNAYRLRMDGVTLAETLVDGTPYALRPAFAQVYNAEITPLLRFQARVTENRRKTGSLRHVLHREASYDSHFKLSRQNLEREGVQGRAIEVAPIRVLERVDADAPPRVVDDPPTEQRLEEMLDRYNALKRNGRSIRVPETLREQFQVLGYRV